MLINRLLIKKNLNMNNIKKYSLLIVALISFLIGWESCNKEPGKVEVVNSDTHSVLKNSQGTDTSFIIPVTRDSAIVARFIETDFFDSIVGHTYLNPQLDSSEKLVITATPQIQGLFIPLTHTDSSYKKIFALYAPDTNLFAYGLIVEVISRVNGNTCLNYYYPNNELGMSIVLDSGNHPIGYTLNPNPIYRPSEDPWCVFKCVANKIDECLSDPSCVIECGLNSEACIACWTTQCVMQCLHLTWGGGGGGSW